MIKKKKSARAANAREDQPHTSVPQLPLRHSANSPGRGPLHLRLAKQSWTLSFGGHMTQNTSANAIRGREACAPAASWCLCLVPAPTAFAFTAFGRPRPSGKWPRGALCFFMTGCCCEEEEWAFIERAAPRALRTAWP
jgi:hypothetical protein